MNDNLLFLFVYGLVRQFVFFICVAVLVRVAVQDCAAVTACFQLAIVCKNAWVLRIEQNNLQLIFFLLKLNRTLGLINANARA